MLANPMKRERSLLATGIVFASVALFGGYILLWSHTSQLQIGRSDFTSTYVGASLWTDGHRADLYDRSLQAHLHTRLIAPDTEGNLPFVNPPLAAVLAAPLTALPLDAAYRTAGLIELALLVAAIAIVIRSAPGPKDMPQRLVGAIVGLALPATLALLLLAQWDGVNALGLALAYALWRRDRRGLGAGVLVFSALIVKPHLALGLAAFVMGWRDRRILTGAVVGAALVGLLSLAAVGPEGLAGFVAATRDGTTAWSLASMYGFTGLTGSWISNTTVAQSLAACLSLLALVACAWLGHRIRTARSRLEPCLAAATALSLLASPHLLMHDLTIMAPAIVWWLSWTARRDAPVWPGRATGVSLIAILGLGLTEALDLGNQAAAPPGRLVPLALLAIGAGLAWTQRHRTPEPA